MKGLTGYGKRWDTPMMILPPSTPLKKPPETLTTSPTIVVVPAISRNTPRRRRARELPPRCQLHLRTFFDPPFHSRIAIYRVVSFMDWGAQRHPYYVPMPTFRGGTPVTRRGRPARARGSTIVLCPKCQKRITADGVGWHLGRIHGTHGRERSDLRRTSMMAKWSA